MGIPIFTAPEVVARLEDGDEVRLDLPSQRIFVREQIYVLPPLSSFTQEIIDAGGIVPYVRKYGRFPGENIRD